MSINSRVRKFRIIKGYSQEYVALQLGISQKAYSKIETGKTRLKLERIALLAAIFKCDIVELLYARSIPFH